MKYALLFLLMVMLFYSCGENIPKYVEVLKVDIYTKSVSYKKVKLEGIKSLDNFESDRFKYLSKAKLRTYISEEDGKDLDLNTATINDINKLTYIDKGVSPSIRYTVKDDTLIPYSLQDSILLTLHYNLNEAIKFFISKGLDLSKGINGLLYGQIIVFYELNIVNPPKSLLEDSEDAIKDNAMYYPFLNSLAFLKQDKLKHLALVSNPMVITHEFAHSIFAYAAEGVLKKDDLYSRLVPKNCGDIHNSFYISAMNEGFSDYWASRKTGSADLFYLSITKHEIGVDRMFIADRSLENDRRLTSEMLVYSIDPDSCQEEADSKSYYWAGTIWASSMWEAQKVVNIENFDKYLLKSYSCLYNEFNKYLNKITMATPGNCFIKTLKQENDVNKSQIDLICNILKKRFSMIKGEFNECN